MGSVSKPELKVTSGFPSRVVVLLCGVSRQECETVRDDLSGSRETFWRPSPLAPSLGLSHVLVLISYFGLGLQPFLPGQWNNVRCSGWRWNQVQLLGFVLLTRVRRNSARRALPFCSCSRPQIGLLLSCLLLAFTSIFLWFCSIITGR